jgi:copper chaperone
MITLKVPDMSCSHCSGVITKAVKRLDPDAEIAFDMHHHMVQVKTAQQAAVLVDTLTNAGYPATLVA